MTDYRRLRVALLGAGAVGSQVAALLRQHADELADRAGARLELVGIAVRNPDAPRDADLPREQAAETRLEGDVPRLRAELRALLEGGGAIAEVGAARSLQGAALRAG